MTAAAPIQPVSYGQSWQRDAVGKFLLPERTLGWQLIEWCEDYLLQPDGPDAGEPWRFTKEQARFLLWWYALDERGRFLYRGGMLRRIKGWGKDPFGAALCCIEFVGPSRFARFGREQPFGEPSYAAWIQTAAVAKDQTRNTMTLFPGMLSKRAIDEFGIDLGKEIIYAYRGRCRIEAVTSSPRALEGGRPTFVLKNETHHWLANNEGDQMSAVIARNAAKTGARVLAISNAHRPGEGSDAQRDWEAYEKIEQGLSKSTGFLYDSLEAPEGTDLDDDDALREGILAARGDSVWLDPERLLAEIRDPRTPPSTARRFYLNQLVADEDRAFDREAWAALEAPRSILPGELITLGFDGSVSRDHTALVATHVETGYQWLAGYWQPVAQANGEMRVPVEEVDAAVAYCFERWKVWRFNSDPYYWGEQLARWSGLYGDDVVVSWSTTLYRKMAMALLAYRNAIAAGEFEHGDDDEHHLTSAIGNAYRREQHFTDDLGQPMWVIEKERPDSPFKIDAAMAACLSWEARSAAITKGVNGDVPFVGVYFA